MVGVDAGHTVGFGAVAAGSTPDAAAKRSVGREFAHVTAAAALYFAVRELVEGSTATALRNAGHIRRLESRVGLDVEQPAQQFVLAHGPLRALGNFSYVWLHWPLLIALLAVLYACDAHRYRRLRDALIWSGAAGLVIFAVFPVSPPRFLPDYVGTVTDVERRHHLPFPIEWANRYASFPSFHVGWTLIASIAVAGLLRPRWLRAVAMLPATLVTLSVVTTGNHFLVDALAGAAISVAAYAIVDACSQRRSEGPWLRATIQAARNYRAAARMVYNHRGPSTLKSRSESPSSTHTEGRVDLTFVQNSMLGQLPVQARDDRPPVFADQPSTIEEVGLR